MKTSRVLVFLTVVVLLCLITACNTEKIDPDEVVERGKDDVNKSDFPIVDEPITLNVFAGKSSVNSGVDWNDLLVWNEYEDMTNVQVDWNEQVGIGNIGEKRVLAMSSGETPDVFFAAQLSNNELYRYGKHGVFIPLNDLIDEYAPNLKKLMDKNPSIKSGMTFPDGHIYAMPYIVDNDFLSMRIGERPWVDQSWLERVNMDMPKTTEEFYQFLKEVKKVDDDIIPYGGVGMDGLVSWISGAFGLNLNGDEFVDLPTDNGSDLRFIPTSPEYREMLEYIHKLYDEGLIDDEIYSIEWEQYIAKASDGTYASTVFQDPASAFNMPGFESASALEGPNGDQMYTGVASPLASNGQFVITNENPNPAATVRWLDYFYSDEGSRMMYMGVEGETYHEEDGEFVYNDEITESDQPEKQISQYMPWVGINSPGLVKEKYYTGVETSDASLESADKIEPYVPENIWPELTYTKDETSVLASKGMDVEKYAGEMRDKFIAGMEKLDDSTWEEYIETLEDMGLNEYMEARQTAYERYADNR